MGQPLIILGQSARGAARAARAAGYDPWCVDVRGERDVVAMPGASLRTCPADQFPMGLLRMAADGPAGAPVLLTAPLENHPQFVRALAFERPILGSGPDAILAVRDPLMLPTLKPVAGLKYCETRTRSSFRHRLSAMVFGAWGRKKHLLKPLRSWGGRGIDWWTPSARLDADHYLQQYIRGQAYTAIFHADGWSCALLGAVEQIVGDRAFGAPADEPFRTCGYIGPVSLSESSRAALSHLGVQLTQRCDVRGLFSVDLVMDMAGTLWPIEVNPRFPAAAELLDRSGWAITLAGARTTPGRGAAMHGMAWVLARSAMTMPDLPDLRTRDDVVGLPPAGHLLAPGDPLCTIFSHAATQSQTATALTDLAAEIHTHLAAATGSVNDPSNFSSSGVHPRSSAALRSTSPTN